MYVAEERGNDWIYLISVKKNLKTDHVQWVKTHIYR